MHEHLYDEGFVVIVSANHRLVRRRKVTLRDLAHERWARGGISERWDPFVEMSLAAGNPSPRTALMTDVTALRDDLVAHAGLLGCTTRRSLQAAPPHFKVAHLPVKELERSRHVCASYRNDGYLSPAGRRLVSILKRMGGKG